MKKRFGNSSPEIFKTTSEEKSGDRGGYNSDHPLQIYWLPNTMFNLFQYMIFVPNFSHFFYLHTCYTSRPSIFLDLLHLCYIFIFGRNKFRILVEILAVVKFSWLLSLS